MGGVNSLDEAFVSKLTEIICRNLENEHFGVDELAREARMHRLYMHQRLVEITSKSSRQFIREIRLRKAMEMLQKIGATASEVAYKAGFGSPAYFNTCFHEHFGYPPGRVIKQGLENQEPHNNKTEDDNVVGTQEPEHKNNNQFNRKGIRRIISIAIPIGLLIIIFHLAFNRVNNPFRIPDTIEASRIKRNEKSIAVLPFKNLSDLKENQNFAEGVTESIQNALMEIRGLKVIPRTSTEQFNSKSGTAPQIAKILGVTFLLEGSVQRSKNRAIVMVTLINAAQDKQIWVQKFEFDFEKSDGFAIEDNISKHIIEQVQEILSIN